MIARAPALAGVGERLYLEGKSPSGLGALWADGRSQMTLPLSTQQAFEQTSAPANRLVLAVVVGGSGLGVVLLLAAVVLWLRYGTAVFFEMIASGFAACF
jgi:hypothetical protein